MTGVVTAIELADELVGGAPHSASVGGHVQAVVDRGRPGVTSVARAIAAQIAREIGAAPEQVGAAAALLDQGATVPFIARYRKEATGGLDDVQLRLLVERLEYLRELEARRATVAASIEEQGRMDDALRARIAAAGSKQALEDLYLPYRPRRRTRAQAAREAGLEPLADRLLSERDADPVALAREYLRAPDADGANGVPDEKSALDGARDIAAERLAERADVVEALRAMLDAEGRIVSTVVAGKESEGTKFSDYFAHAEPVSTVPSHRALALFRARGAGVVSLRLALDEAREALVPHPCVVRVAGIAGLADVFDERGEPAGRGTDRWVAELLRWTWRVKLQPHVESALFAQVRERAEAQAIRVFGANLKDLLLSAPAGRRTVIGLDPGVRTGVKLAVVDPTGKLLETGTVYPFEPRRDREGAVRVIAELARRHGASLAAIGNGTASRETDRLVAEVAAAHPELGLRRVTVSEAGASVYSASEAGTRELPGVDVSLRGAVSIARRLQDPLAELVKIEPKAIGVGQYQHDVNQRALAKSLEAVVEDCVNAVGVDVNTASGALLAHVSGLSAGVAQRIVAHRDANGPFIDRASLRAVPQFGERAFEQAAGFLRIAGGGNPLDASAVHPEAYPLVERILARIGKPAIEVIGRRELLRGIEPGEFADERFGVPTIADILVELEKPGRDPRGTFESVVFDDAVRELSDLKPGMRLKGVVTNVANFGAFVDVGVHQDGLVHVSQLADRFVREARDVVKVGQVVEVTVLEVDAARRRVALTMRGDARPESSVARSPARGRAGARGSSAGGGRDAPSARDPQTALGAALAQAMSGAQAASPTRRRRP